MAAMWARVSKHLAWLWLCIPLTALFETAGQFWIPLREPSQEEWHAAADYAKSLKGEGDLIALAPDFASQGLVYLRGGLDPTDFGRFDASRYAHVIALSVNGAEVPETAGLPLEKERAFGRISVQKFANPRRADVRFDFTRHLARARFSGKAIRKPKFLVDTKFKGRLAIPLTPQNRPASVTFEGVPLEGDIYGYAFIAITDFRKEVYDRDGPLSFEVFVDDESVGQRTVRKGEPLRPFRFEMNKEGVGRVRFEARALESFSHFGFGFVADIRR
jgi:hypothetical protein